jgi:hypothetical protein
MTGLAHHVQRRLALCAAVATHEPGEHERGAASVAYFRP